MPRAQANGIEIEYECHGPSDGRPLLLLRGLGTQMIHWHPDLIGAFVAAGHRVVVFDNRDVGLSTHLHEAGMPDIAKLMQDSASGDALDVAYRVSDMASDTIALMDALDLEQAHLAGISMGGMIVQQAAIQSPERVLSISSIMSTTGEPGLPGPSPEAAAVLMTPAPTEREPYIEHTLRNNRVIGSPGFRFDEAWQRDVANRVFDRALDGQGVARQLAAVMASGSRKDDLGKLRIPALVIHGDGDPLLRLACGEATAKAIPNARLEVIAGMGHDLPRDAWDVLVGEISQHTRDAAA